ncbi:cytochrome P450 307a1-like [Sitophilus oryzae]|uniref:Cytochrome P450 307a1-like n=1 Tax=Sitophilus oryzae TaxID=7048 RepID=A0A6J2XVF5_SITOR|nr:cytochrome P450 307a1-like [Sitophilus oryzae]
MVPLFTIFLLIVLIIVILVTCFEFFKSRDVKEEGTFLQEPPSPRRLPIIGHMHLLAGYEVPYQAFADLGKKFGSVFKLQLGSVKCVVVNEQRNVREALVTKGHHFDYRPNFERYQSLFSGNKENSLAFCDWSSTQKVRREMLKAYTFPRAFTNKYVALEQIISKETQQLIGNIEGEEGSVHLKPILLKKCANIFLKHFCTESFNSNDAEFEKMVENFDEVFYEVNQGYAADFLPFLMPFHQKKMQKMSKVTHEIREFITKKVIKDKFTSFNCETEPNDYLESLIRHVKLENQKDSESPTLDWEMALFALEDIIGGHSAVGNFLIKLFGFLVDEPEVQKKIQTEIDRTVGSDRSVTICDRNNMPYTEGVIFEAIRLIASPIVPRVANQTSSINGYKIEKGTVLFLNNYDLSMSEKLWDSPDKFQPERFVKNEKFFKPEHFLPFGGGRRSCMGYKLVQLVSFGVLSAIMQRFNIRKVQNESYTVPVGSLALGKDTFKFRFEKR